MREPLLAFESAVCVEEGGAPWLQRPSWIFLSLSVTPRAEFTKVLVGRAAGPAKAGVSDAHPRVRAAARPGPAGSIYIARLLWHNCVLRGLRDIYGVDVCNAQLELRVHNWNSP